MSKLQIHSTTKLILISVLVCVSYVGFSDERGQSIMFGDTPGSQNDNPLKATHSPLDSMNNKNEHCAKLVKEIELLKGKPQRRYAAIQRFKSECGSEPLNEKMDQ